MFFRDFGGNGHRLRPPVYSQREKRKIFRVSPYRYMRQKPPKKNGMASSPTGGVFSYLPHHLDLTSEDSVGHSTCMSVLVRRRAIMGSIVQPKRSCLGAATRQRNPHTGGANGHTYPTAKNSPTTPPLTLTLTLTHQPPHDSPATRQHTHACTVTNQVF